MKRSKKLIALLAVLAVLVGAAYAIPALFPEEGVDEEEDTSFTLFTLDPDTVTAISWTCGEETLSMAYDGEAWGRTGDAAFPLDASYIEAMLDTLSEITGYKTIDEPEELAEYGLARPVCTVTISADAEYQIDLGDETTMGGERYISIGDGKVYLAAEEIVDCFEYGLYDIVQMESVPAMSDLKYVSVDTDVQDLELVYLENSGLTYSDSYVWFEKTADGYRVLDTELTKSLISNITGLSWDACVDHDAGDRLADYGLDAPRVVVTIGYVKTVQVATNETDEDGNVIYDTQTEDASSTLEIGADTDDGSYARIAGSGMVYLLGSDICETLSYTTVAELQPDEVLLLDWEEVTAVDVTLDGEVYRIVKTTQEVTDEDGNTTEETVYTLNGEQIAIEDVLEALTALDATGYTGGVAPERTQEIGFTFYRDRESYPVVTLSFYQYDSSSCLTELNGESTLFVSRSDVLTIVEAINQLIL